MPCWAGGLKLSVLYPNPAVVARIRVAWLVVTPDCNCFSLPTRERVMLPRHWVLPYALAHPVELYVLLATVVRVRIIGAMHRVGRMEQCTE